MTGGPLRSELAPMGFGDLLSLAIRLVQARFAQLLPAVALLTAPLHFLSAWLLEWLATDPDWERVDRFGNTTIHVDTGDVVAFLLSVVLSLSVAVVATQLGTAAALRVLPAGTSTRS